MKLACCSTPAAVKVKNLEIVKRFETLVNPQREIPYEASRVNGITNEMLLGAPKAEEVLPELLEFLHTLEKDKIFPYDNHNQRQFFKTLGKSTPEADPPLEDKTFLSTSHRRRRLSREVCLVAHNINFDLGFLNNELTLAGLPPIGNVPMLDTVEMARELLPHLRRHALGFLANALGIKQRQGHRAMSDVETTYRLFCHLLEIAEREGSSSFSL